MNNVRQGKIWIGILVFFLITAIGALAFIKVGCGREGKKEIPPPPTTTTTSITATTATTSTTTTSITGTTTTTTTTTSTTTTTLPKASAPVYDLPSGSYDINIMTVTIEAGATGADAIYYSVDGSPPTTSSAHYTAPFTIDTSRVIKAIAVKSGYQQSDIATATYDIYWWQPIGNGFPSGAVKCIAGGFLYAGGSFTTPNHIARWTGSAWVDVGAGADDDVLAIAYEPVNKVHFVGGEFTSTPHIGIAEWNETYSQWNSMLNGLQSGSVCALALTDNGHVYAGGYFTHPYGSRVSYWNIATWEALDLGIDDNAVYSLAYDNTHDYLYAGGSFTEASNVNTSRIARWDGTDWEALQGGVNHNVYALVLDSSNNLYAGGRFTQFTNNGESTTCNRVAKWDGSNWSRMGDGMDGNVYAMAVDSQDNIYAGGTFTSADGVSAYRIAKWNGSSWSALPGEGMNDDVYAIYIDSSDNIYVGGEFTSTQDGSLGAWRIIKWGKK